MITLKEKNDKAKMIVADLESPSQVRDLMRSLNHDWDWRMKSLVYYHLIRRLMDDETFLPEDGFEMENVHRPFAPKTWYLPDVAMFPAYDSGSYSFADCFDAGETAFVINLCSFVEENPIIGFRSVCGGQCGDTVIVKGFVSHDDVNLQKRYSGWEFYRADKRLTDDMTAVLGRDFGHVFRAEVAHLDPEDGKLHRIYMTNG